MSHLEQKHKWPMDADIDQFAEFAQQCYDAREGEAANAIEYLIDRVNHESNLKDEARELAKTWRNDCMSIARKDWKQCLFPWEKTIDTKTMQ